MRFEEALRDQDLPLIFQCASGKKTKHLLVLAYIHQFNARGCFELVRFFSSTIEPLSFTGVALRRDKPEILDALLRLGLIDNSTTDAFGKELSLAPRVATFLVEIGHIDPNTDERILSSSDLGILQLVTDWSKDRNRDRLDNLAAQELTLNYLVDRVHFPPQPIIFGYHARHTNNHYFMKKTLERWGSPEYVMIFLTDCFKNDESWFLEYRQELIRYWEFITTTQKSESLLRFMNDYTFVDLGKNTLRPDDLTKSQVEAYLNSKMPIGFPTVLQRIIKDYIISERHYNLLKKEINLRMGEKRHLLRINHRFPELCGVPVKKRKVDQ